MPLKTTPRPLNVQHQLEIFKAAAGFRREAENLLLEAMMSVILDLLEEAGDKGIEYWELHETIPEKLYSDPVISGHHDRSHTMTDSDGAFSLAVKQLRDSGQIVSCEIEHNFLSVESRFFLPAHAKPSRRRWWR